MVDSTTNMKKIPWSGHVVAIQQRIRPTRSFDERSHSYLGYVLCIERICGGEIGESLIAVGEAAYAKYRFQTGMELSDCSVPVEDPKKETAAFYTTAESRPSKMRRTSVRPVRRFMACRPILKPTGPARKVPGRNGMSYTEEDWVDEDATAHRGPDD